MSMLSLSTENSKGFQDFSDIPHPLATPREKYLWGLLKGPEFSRKNVELRVVPGRGRSAFAARQFKGGDFVCEYRGEVREKQEDDWGDRRNASLGIGSYCFDATHEGKTYVFDASGSINDPGRYINHASKNYNLQKMPPVMIGDPPSLRIGFVAKRDIKYGDELFFHYGLKPSPDFPWISSDARKMSTTLQQQDQLSEAIER